MTNPSEIFEAERMAAHNGRSWAGCSGSPGWERGNAERNSTHTVPEINFPNFHSQEKLTSCSSGSSRPISIVLGEIVPRVIGGLSVTFVVACYVGYCFLSVMEYGQNLIEDIKHTAVERISKDTAKYGTQHGIVGHLKEGTTVSLANCGLAFASFGQNEYIAPRLGKAKDPKVYAVSYSEEKGLQIFVANAVQLGMFRADRDHELCSGYVTPSSFMPFEYSKFYFMRMLGSNGYSTKDMISLFSGYEKENTLSKPVATKIESLLQAGDQAVVTRDLNHIRWDDGETTRLRAPIKDGEIVFIDAIRGKIAYVRVLDRAGQEKFFTEEIPADALKLYKRAPAPVQQKAQRAGKIHSFLYRENVGESYSAVAPHRGYACPAIIGPVTSASYIHG